MAHVKKGPNFLLHGLVIISVGIHILLFLYLKGIYRPKVFQVIEMALKQEPKPKGRAIPRAPRIQKPKSEKPSKAKLAQIVPTQIPDAMPSEAGAGLGSFSGGGIGGGAMTQEGYLEMVNMKVQRTNKYPPGANEKRREGVVLVSFIINLSDGTIRDLKILKPCPYQELNDQALKSIRDSAPFLKPPQHLFKKDVYLEMPITFQLI